MLNDPYPAVAVRQAMRVTLAASGFDEGSGGVAKGQVDIFPAQDRVDVDIAR